MSTVIRHFTAMAAMVASIAVVAPNTSSADEPAALTRLRESYDKTEDLAAKFSQVARMAASGMDQRSTGSVVFKKGGKMRWTYDGDDPQILVSDGKTLWIHQVRDKTVLKQEINRLQPASKLALDLLSGFNEVESGFAISECGASCLVLTPREASTELSRVTVEVMDEDQIVKTVTTEDALGNQTLIEFSGIERNAGVKEEFFNFSPPVGSQILDMMKDSQ